MDRFNITKRIGENFVTSNIEGGEFSYVQAAGSKSALMESLPNNQVKHFKVDIRFLDGDFVVLVETKQQFKDSDKLQLAEYVAEEKALFPRHKIIAILANTVNDKIRVWKDQVDNEHELKKETVIDSMEHYKKIFTYKNTNNREQVQKSAVILNDMLRAKEINERTRSQFGGTLLLYIQDVLKKKGISEINDNEIQTLYTYWGGLSAKQICSGIQETIENLLDGTKDKETKMRLTCGNIIANQAVKKLSTSDWVEILVFMTRNIYTCIDTKTVEGQDILNQFFTTFNKYVGKADKNQAYTPDHIGEWMVAMLNVNENTIIADPTCGSGSFLVQASVKEMNACNRNVTETEAEKNKIKVRTKNICGIEKEEIAYGLAITNMMLHGISSDSIRLASTFDCFEYLVTLGANVYTMNPPYNAIASMIPEKYRIKWGKMKDAKEDPTKGLVFVQFISDVVKERNKRLCEQGLPPETARLAVLLPVAVARGTTEVIRQAKEDLLKDNTLEAVFTLPNEVFYPGAAVHSCCMMFTLGEPHVKPDGTANKTFFGYFKDDAHKKKKNIGRVEIVDENGKGLWKLTEAQWLSLFRNKETSDGISAMAEVTADDEWLCEEYMTTDYSNLSNDLWQKEAQNLAAYEVKTRQPDNTDKVSADKWKEFTIEELFPKQKVKHYSSIPDCEGTIPFITSTSDNNGVAAWVDVDDALDGNAITVSTNGNCFDCFYQEQKFAVSNDVEVLYGEHLNKYTALFVIPLLKQEQKKYSYGRKAKNGKVFSTKIKLPAVCDNGKYIPDWEHMENFIKNMDYVD